VSRSERKTSTCNLRAEFFSLERQWVTKDDDKVRLSMDASWCSETDKSAVIDTRDTA
jgi:hypothetical protein